MNQVDRRLAKLEADGAKMVALNRMNDLEIRGCIAELLLQANDCSKKVESGTFEELATELANLRDEIGMVMRECELRAQA